MPRTTDKFSRLRALEPARPSAAPPDRPRLCAPDEEDALAQLLGAGVAGNHFGEHLAIRNWYSTPEYAEPSAITLELLSRTRDAFLPPKTRAMLEDPSRWLFLDTETTGLAGGTGTYAFLIGVGWWDAGGFEVEQFFMRDFTEEYSLLQELAVRITERPVLLTFNGKSFDWPLLENRFAMTRSIVAPKLAAHLDLLHPARALWKLRLGSVRLMELERRVLDRERLGWQRKDDVDCTRIPQHYFDYLRGGPVAPLAGVVRHNQMDLRGLAALFGKINRMLSDSADRLGEYDSLDLFGLSRFFERRGDHERAAGIWEEMVRDFRDEVHACEQLAIYYERRAKDSERALEYARLGLARLRRQRTASSGHAHDPSLASRLARQEKHLIERSARLERKAPPRSSRAPRRGAPGAAEPKANSALW